MGKVKVTKEQADTIERLRKYQRDEIERFTRNPSYFADWVSPLKNMDVNEIEDSLYIGYEVEPEIEKGDYVYREDSKRIGRVYGIYGGGKEVAIHGMALPAYDSSSVRRATQKEKREYIKSDIRNDLGWITRSVIHDYAITNTDIYFSDNDKDIQLTVNARIEEEIK